ncbi:MAG: hypothetical protein WC227_01260 [Patescibacteria group bacterium]|jgi:hypothetical protein
MKKNLIFAYSFIGQIGLTTAIPLVFFGLLGRSLDRKYFPEHHYLFFGGLVLATAIIYFAIKQLVVKMLKQFESINKQ